MGHNVSTRKRTSMTMRLPLADFRGWRLAVECGGRTCQPQRAYDVTQLAAAYPACSVGDAIRRMRCQGCSGSPVSAVLEPGPGMPSRNPRIALVGPGSV